ncbi:glycosyltransferase family 2 protein [Neorhizobium galegae]|nr:glycosyltransferase family 2 protein [Neorhizobium galegae]
MRPKLSIVTTLYRSMDTIEEFIQRALAAGEAVSDDIEIVIVDDGSPDGSVTIVRRWVELDPRISLVCLSRNFGHHRAMLVGLEHAQGDLVFLIDSDLEEPPELLSEMSCVLREKAVDCVYGLQESRKGGRIERISGRIFYWLFSVLSEVRIPENVSTMRLMTRRYVTTLLKFRDKNPVFVPLSILAGYPQASFSFVKTSTSDTTYSLGRRVALTALAITTFSAKPLMLMLCFSLIMAFLGIVYGAFVVFHAMTGPIQDGWSSLMAVVVFFFSLNAVFTGLMGLYVKQILEEVKDRPRTIVQDIYSRGRYHQD